MDVSELLALFVTGTYKSTHELVVTESFTYLVRIQQLSKGEILNIKGGQSI